MKRGTVALWWEAGIVVLTVVLVAYLLVKAVDCRRMGGVFVRTLVGVECLRR